MIATAPTTQEFLLTIDDYYKMGEVGIFPHETRVELINGRILYKKSISSFHSFVSHKVIEKLYKKIGDDVVVRCKNPVHIQNNSVPEPDIALAKLPSKQYCTRHPEPKDIYLVIEVAESSIQFDTGEKLKMCALANIPEYWVIDLNDYKIHVYRQPDGDKYLFEEIIDDSGIATCKTIDFQLNAKEIFG